MSARRRVLGLAASTLAAAAGCNAAPDFSSDPATPNTTTLPANERARAEADPISVERTVSDSDNEYIPENDTVRYAAIASGGSVDEYHYVSFDEWANNKAETVAARGTREFLETRLQNTAFVSVRSGSFERPTPYVEVVHRTEVDDSGTVVNEPEISVSRLVEATPSSITVTADIAIAGKSVTREYPVFVLNAVVEQLWTTDGP
ncbi:hypothetical protein [Halobacterium zhouii]|uniref:hypothetical protein n=1 Tax=Halobacterium zhouii TaxID=2902624 RepID=UPI001E5B8BDC|nr:hypothetical protein [Halobacterium zhouii]